MRILIIGGGGREHALAWKCAQSAQVTQVLVAPGNAGTAHEVKVQNVAVSADDLPGLLALAQREHIDLTIVGPEGALVAGITDLFEQHGLRCFGPSKAAAQLEGSKVFTKQFLARHGIPTAAYRSFTRSNFDREWIAAQAAPLVVKASGLASGKGVIIAATTGEAIAAVEAMFAGRFGQAGDEVVVEAFLQGEEASFIVLCDGRSVLPMASAQDHKRIGDGDTGPNTGGMGAYSPAPVVTAAVHERVMRQVIAPTVAGLAAEGMPFVGFLYAGLMIDPSGAPFVIEYNCRFGDPETQPILMRLQSDLPDLCIAALEGRLQRMQTVWDERAAVGVVLAAAGYPDTVRTGDVISGLDAAAALPGKVFQAGTRLQDGKVLTSGGRVLCATGLGQTVLAAQQQAYALADCIQYRGAQYRRDIGYRAIARETGQPP